MYNKFTVHTSDTGFSTTHAGNSCHQVWVSDARTYLNVVQDNPDHVGAHGHDANVPPAGCVVGLLIRSRHLRELQNGLVRVPLPGPAHQCWADVHEQGRDLQQGMATLGWCA